MKKFLLLLGITLTTSFGILHSQNTNSTTTVPTTVFRNMYIAAEQKKVLEEKVQVLNERIFELEGIINDLKSKDSINAAIVQNYQGELAITKEIRAIYESKVKSLEDELKQQKKKTFWTAVGGIVATVGIIFLTK